MRSRNLFLLVYLLGSCFGKSGFCVFPLTYKCQDTHPHLKDKAGDILNFCHCQQIIKKTKPMMNWFKKRIQSLLFTQNELQWRIMLASATGCFSCVLMFNEFLDSNGALSRNKLLYWTSDTHTILVRWVNILLVWSFHWIYWQCENHTILPRLSFTSKPFYSCYMYFYFLGPFRYAPVCISNINTDINIIIKVLDELLF